MIRICLLGCGILQVRGRDGQNGKEVEVDWQNYTVSFHLSCFKAEGYSSFRLHVQDSSILDLP